MSFLGKPRKTRQFGGMPGKSFYSFWDILTQTVDVCVIIVRLAAKDGETSRYQRQIHLVGLGKP